jgi:hypothetical protein
VIVSNMKNKMTNTKLEKPLPCPICGCKPQTHFTSGKHHLWETKCNGGNKKWWHVLHAHRAPTKEESIKRWNTLVRIIRQQKYQQEKTL